MYCKKCGTEQKDGHKFCPKCGTPYNDIEQIGSDSSNEVGLTIDKIQEMNNPSESEQMQEQRNGNETNGTRLLTPNEEKKVVRIAKGGMWIIVIAIVFTFVRAGFGFSIWWYLYLTIMAIIAFVLWFTAKPDSDTKLNDGDAILTKGLSWIGAAMLVMLYMWGPLNSNYTVSHSKEHRSSLESYEQSSNSSDSDDSAHSWIQGTWECDTPYGAIIIRIDGDRIYEDYGDGVMSGTYRIYDNAIHPNTGNPVTYELDMSSHRILDGRGGYFRKR